MPEGLALPLVQLHHPFIGLACWRTDNTTGIPKQPPKVGVTKSVCRQTHMQQRLWCKNRVVTVRTSYVVATVDGVTIICMVTNGNRHSHAGSACQTAAVQCVNALFSPHQHQGAMHRLTRQGRAVKLVACGASVTQGGGRGFHIRQGCRQFSPQGSMPLALSTLPSEDPAADQSCSSGKQHMSTFLLLCSCKGAAQQALCNCTYAHASSIETWNTALH